MDDAYKVATRILVVYESKLPYGRLATFAERLEAMEKTVEVLNLKENGPANLKEIIRGSVATV